MTRRVVAYADPPYLGCARKHYGDHPEHAVYDTLEGHAALIARLVEQYPDGWALSCTSGNARLLLPFCPEDVRVMAWINHRPRSDAALWSWDTHHTGLRGSPDHLEARGEWGEAREVLPLAVHGPRAHTSRRVARSVPWERRRHAGMETLSSTGRYPVENEIGDLGAEETPGLSLADPAQT